MSFQKPMTENLSLVKELEDVGHNVVGLHGWQVELYYFTFGIHEEFTEVPGHGATSQL